MRSSAATIGPPASSAAPPQKHRDAARKSRSTARSRAPESQRPVRRLGQGSKTPGVREIAERDDLADGDEASLLDRAQVGGVRQARELRRDAPLAELARQLGRPEKQRPAPRRVRRELGRAPQRADPHGGRPALERPSRGLLELA